MVAQSEKESLLRQIDEFGEDEIRYRLKGLNYDRVQKQFLQAELERRDRKREKFDQTEMLATAQRANNRATIGIGIAVLALAVSILQLLR